MNSLSTPASGRGFLHTRFALTWFGIRQLLGTLVRFRLSILAVVMGVFVFGVVVFCLGLFMVDFPSAAPIGLMCAVPLALAIAWEDLEAILRARAMRAAAAARSHWTQN